MGGKAILLVVMGFSLVFSVVNHNSSTVTTRSVENLSEYYSKTNLQNIASSGANIMANTIFQDPTWTGNYTKIPFMGGEIDISVSNFSVDKKLIKSTAYFKGIYDGQVKYDTTMVKIILQPSSFSKFGYYTNNWPSNGYLVTGDTIDGPFHTQDKLNTLGSPVFTGKVSTLDGLKSVGNKWGFGDADPQFLGGYEEGVDVPFDLDPTKLLAAADYDGRVFNEAATNPMDLRLVFNDDETVTWSTRQSGTSTWSTPILAKLDTLAPNGVIWNKSGDLYLSGTVSGNYTVGTAKEGNNYGYVYLEDDIVYREDPLQYNGEGNTETNPDCEDMLGIVAEKQVVVKNNTANQSDINIHATMFNYDGGITVEGISSSSPDMGIMRIHGGLIENEAQTTGYTNGAGYNQVIKFDKRFQKKTPPYFPATETYEIVSWFE